MVTTLGGRRDGRVHHAEQRLDALAQVERRRLAVVRHASRDAPQERLDVRGGLHHAGARHGLQRRDDVRHGRHAVAARLHVALEHGASRLVRVRDEQVQRLHVVGHRRVSASAERRLEVGVDPALDLVDPSERPHHAALWRRGLHERRAVRRADGLSHGDDRAHAPRIEDPLILAHDVGIRLARVRRAPRRVRRAWIALREIDGPREVLCGLPRLSPLRVEAEPGPRRVEVLTERREV